MVEVFFATNRNLVDGNTFGRDFNPDGPEVVRFGWADVERQNRDDYKVKAIHPAEEDFPLDFEGKVDWARAKRGSCEVFNKVRERMSSGNCDVIVLIHGYASDFDTALARIAEISVDYSTPDKEVVGFAFSWPANGRMIPYLDYLSDQREAALSGDALVRTFYILHKYLNELRREDYCHGSINLMAHSMGNWALQYALEELHEECGANPPCLFNQIFLVAADVDNDVFEHKHKFEMLPQLGKAVHVYFSEDDRALMVSDFTKLNPDRLGATGPKYGSNRPKIHLVDCRDVDEPDRISEEPGKRYDISVHQYYRLRREVIQDIQQILAGKAPSDIRGRRLIKENGSYRIIPFNQRARSRELRRRR